MRALVEVEREEKKELPEEEGIQEQDPQDVYKRQILTIHQSIPINGIATLTLSIEILSTTGNISEMVDEMEENEGVHYLKIVGRE